MVFFFNPLMREQPSWVLLFSFLGLLSLLRAISALSKWLYVTFLRPGKDLKSYGSWALVTGATDGIGKAFAFQLAHHGLHLVLVGRNLDKLRHVSKDIKAKYNGVDVKLVVVDLAGDLYDGVRRLEEEIEGLDIGILVNNAGTTYPHAMYFHEVEEEIWEAIVKVNVEGTTRVSRAVMPAMVKRGKGAVVNVGSGASVVVPSFPLYAVYAATKAYVDQFSRSLFVEYKRLGIDVQCQIPLYVATKMVSVQQSTTFIPSPDEYAGAALRRIGYEPRCTPYWAHSIQWGFASIFLPHFALNAWRLQIGKTKRDQAKFFKNALN